MMAAPYRTCIRSRSWNSRTIAKLIPIGGNPRKGRHSLNLRVMLASRNQTRSLHSCRKDEVI